MIGSDISYLHQVYIKFLNLSGGKSNDLNWTYLYIFMLVFDIIKLSNAKYIMLQLISQDLNMLKTCNSLSSFQKAVSNTNIQLKFNTLNHPHTHSQLLLQSLVDDSQGQQSVGLLGLESQKSRLTNKSTKSSVGGRSKLDQNCRSMPLSQIILQDNGYDYLFCEKSQQIKLEQMYLQNLRQEKNQVEDMLSLVALHLLIAQSADIKHKIHVLQKEISRLRAHRKTNSPFHHYSEYLGDLEGKRKQRLSGRLLHLALHDKYSAKTHCDSKTPSLPSAPVSPVSHCKLMLSPRIPASPKPAHSARYISILQQKIAVVKASSETACAFNAQQVQHLKQENELYRKEISLVDSLLAVEGKRKSNYRSTVGHFNSSASHRNLRHSRKLPQHSSSNTSSRKSQIIKLVANARRDLAASPRQQYYYRSGQ